MKKVVNKKNIFILVALIFTLGFVVLIISLKSIFAFKPSFYSYSSYADQKTKQEINKSYTYKEYATVNEFEYAFSNNKAIAGITSDYSIISLIKEGRVAPISKEIIEINQLQNPWESYFSESTQEQMKEYDRFLDHKTQIMLRNQFPEYGNDYIFKFHDFIVPYFINDKVLAFDTKKVLNELYEQGQNENPLNFEQIPTLVEALNKLEEKLKDIKIQWTKNERENVVMGSTLNNPLENWDTQINQDNYLALLNNFSQIVFEGTKATMSDIKRNLFDTDSDIILNNLINPTSKIDAAYLYNGDALDAYYGNDNFHEVNDGDRLRIIRTKYTVRVLDAFIVSSSINQEDRKKLLDNFNKTC